MDRIHFLDLAGLHAEIEERMAARWAELVDAGGFLDVRHVERFEQRWADHCGVADAVGVTDGVAALELLLLGLGIGPGDEVIVPANVEIAVADAVSLAGATPVFVDVDPTSLLLTGADVRVAIGPRTSAVVAAHLFGHPVDLTELTAVCDEAGIALVEEASHAPIAEWSGRRVGSFGVGAVFDFGPTSNLAGVGSGGAVVTSDPGLAARVRQLAAPDENERGVGPAAVPRQGRLDVVPAVMLDVVLDRLDRWNIARRRVFDWYEALLPPNVELVRPLDGSAAVHHLLVVRVNERERARRALTGARIDTGLHHALPCHRVAPYDVEQPSLPVVERVGPTLLSLPMHPRLSRADVARVCEVLGGALLGDRPRPTRPAAPTRPMETPPAPRPVRKAPTGRRRWLRR